MAEKRALRMHPRLLWDVITKQAGTLEKAVLEGVMNSCDAGATRCDVTIDRDTFSITDDGKGFASMEEIENFFETFGYPHEEGDARYGRFRMGRGQMFAFGANTWLSNGYKMHVDLRPQEALVSTEGLGYEFSEVADGFRGCSISVALYKRLKPSDVDDVAAEIGRYVAWSPIPVTVNGKVVNRDPAKAKWDVETEDAYIKYREGGDLTVYNLGVLVCNEHASRYGTGGLIVSKRQLDVNFARNSVMDKCPVWRRVVAQVRKDAGTAIKRKSNRLNESERHSAIKGFLNGRMSTQEACKLPLWELVNGNRISLETLGERLRNSGRGRIAFATLKDRTASRVLEAKLAVVLSEATLDLAECETASDLMGKIQRALVRSPMHGMWDGTFDPKRLREIGMDQMRAIVPDGMDNVPDSKLKPAEKFALSVIRAGCDQVGSVFGMVSRVKEGGRRQDWVLERLEEAGISGTLLDRMMARTNGASGHREVKAGESAIAHAWTDGTQNVWFERGELALVGKGHKGMSRLAALAIHEWLHDSPDTETHVHDAEFYETFHDILLDSNLVGLAVNAMIDRATRLIRDEDRKPSGAFKKAEDTKAVLADHVLDLGDEPEAAPAPGMAA